jgi:hypothetical protein
MDSPSTQSGPSDYLETLKRAGAQAIKEFDNVTRRGHGS